MNHKRLVPKAEPSEPATVDFSNQPNTWSWGWAVLLLASLLLFAAAGFVAHQHTLTGVELSIFHHINGWPDQLRPLFLVLTVAPESLWIGVVAVVVTFLLKMYRTAWLLSATTIIGYGATFVGKHLFGRARPEELIGNVHVRVHETGMGFPSGHTMMITVLVVALWPYLPRGWRWLAALCIPAMALSRIYLGVHSPLDVVGGFAVGAGVVAAIRVLPPVARRFLRFD
jgi:undecaprenyl-diphosphatase